MILGNIQIRKYFGLLDWSGQKVDFILFYFLFSVVCFHIVVLCKQIIFSKQNHMDNDYCSIEQK